MVILVLLGACLAALSALADALLVFRWSTHNDPYQAPLWAAGAVISPCLAFGATLLIGSVLVVVNPEDRRVPLTEAALLLSLALTWLLNVLQQQIFVHPHLHHLYLCLSILAAILVGTTGGHWFVTTWIDGS